MVYLRVGGVDVFLLHTLRGGIEFTTTKGDNLTTDIQPREDGTTRETVVNTTLILNTQTRLYQELIFITLTTSLIH